LALEFHL